MPNVVIDSVLGVDYGEARVGIAGLEANSRRAVPLVTLPRTTAEAKLIELIAQYNITLLVVGLPLSSENEESPLCGRIRSFCRRIKRRISVEVRYEDEYCSSIEASEAHRPSRKLTPQQIRKSGQVDANAAALILQRFLDRSG